MKGDFHVQFLGEGVAATSPPYPTPGGAIPWGHPACFRPNPIHTFFFDGRMEIRRKLGSDVRNVGFTGKSNGIMGCRTRSDPKSPLTPSTPNCYRPTSKMPRRARDTSVGDRSCAGPLISDRPRGAAGPQSNSARDQQSPAPGSPTSIIRSS